MSPSLEWDSLFVAEAQGFRLKVISILGPVLHTKEASILLSILRLGFDKPRIEACIIITRPPTTAHVAQPFILLPLPVYSRQCYFSSSAKKELKKTTSAYFAAYVAFHNFTHNTTIYGCCGLGSSPFLVMIFNLVAKEKAPRQQSSSCCNSSIHPPPSCWKTRFRLER